MPAANSGTGRKRSPEQSPDDLQTASPSRRLKAPVFDGTGKKSKDLTLDELVFGAEVKPHLVHEAVRAELSADRAGTRAVKSRGLVAGGRSKPWRQKGTGRARAGTTRAPHWTGGGAAFAVRTRFGGKVNRKERKAAFRAALSAHADEGTFAVLADDSFEEPSTRDAATLVEAWGKQRPLIVVAHEDQEAIVKSFRNLDGVQVVTPSEVEISAVVWARSLLVSERALQLVQGRASS
ncbi:MAG: 50S ribosomal protein L4 [Actinobacteria bacterium]|nr:MAG: 50S ribosomal protein L4 [Actinomycetota bacterium]